MTKLVSILSILGHLAVTYLPWVQAALIPTIIVGLSLTPKTEGAVPVLQKIGNYIKQFLYILSVSGYKDENRGLKVPLYHYTHVRTAPKSSGGPGCAALVLVLAASLMSVSGCSCWTQQQKMNTPACVIARQVVSCTGNAVMSGMGQVAVDIIQAYIQTNPKPDWHFLEQKLEGAGISDGGCIIAQIEADLGVKAMASPDLAPKYEGVHDLLLTWKIDHHIVGVKFQVTRSDGKLVTL